jgi:hypothetical protein
MDRPGVLLLTSYVYKQQLVEEGFISEMANESLRD